jgi:undecaprenyl-diphosphatase
MNEIIITFLASFLIWVMFAGLLILWIIVGKVNREEALHALGSAFLIWVVTQVIKVLFPTLRPFQVSGGPVLTLTVPFDSAFPSSHAAVAFGLAITLSQHNKKIGFLYLIAAVLVGVGRLLANVHYFWDIVVGSFLGIAIAVVIGKPYFLKLLKGFKSRF